MRDQSQGRVGFVIFAYRVSPQLLGVLPAMDPEADVIFTVDDGCPQGSGALVRRAHIP